jgi:RNA-directed DNA polymerase
MQSASFIRRRLKLKVNEAKARWRDRRSASSWASASPAGENRNGASRPRLCFGVSNGYGNSRDERGIRLEQMTKELTSYLRGWKGYFGFSQTPSVLQKLEAWMRRRLRTVIWKPWKRSKVRYVRLRQRNIGHDLAAPTAGRPHGPWRLANSPALQSALPLAYFDSCGLPRLLDVL